jgi:crotonobetainyl-CoA:carnitine CoA-transferase CaiB-like acyl-CoA transferase
MTDDALQPYRGVRVLDLAQGLAGPYAAGMLAATGADVIKAEPPEGDWGRLMGESRHGNGSMSLPANWGKRAVCVDARQAQGKAVLKRLAAGANVVVESFRPGVMARLGLDYETLSAEHPGLIFASISGFGQDGPYARRPGSDSIMQAMSGMAAMNRDASGKPRRIGMLVVDMVTATYAGFALSSALFEQRASGCGRHLEISLLEAASAFQMTALLQDRLREGDTGGTLATAPAGYFPTRTGMIAVTCVRETMFAALCQELGRPEWPDDPRFASNAERLRNVEALHQLIATELAARDREYWVERLNAAGVLCGPVNDYADLVADEQVRHVDLFAEVDTAEFGRLPFAALPGGTLQPGQLRPAPAIGGDTRAVLAEAGYGENEIAELLQGGICHQAGEGSP